MTADKIESVTAHEVINTNEISAIMANIEGWKKADNKVRFPIYGIVRGYCRDRETKAKNGNA